MLKKDDKAVHVVIPAYNEEGNVGQVIKGLKQLNLGLVIWVVDDGSKDGTTEEARNAGARVVRHSVNLGQWAALRTGFTLALLDDAKIIVSMDADGQHNPMDLPKLVEPLNGEGADLIICSRFLDEEKPEMLKHRRFGIRFFNKFLEMAFRCKLTDCTNGFKAYRADLIRKVLPELREEQYGALEFIAKVTKQNAKIKEVPIKSIINNSSKKGKIRYAYNLLRTTLKETINW